MTHDPKIVEALARSIAVPAFEPFRKAEMNMPHLVQARRFAMKHAERALAALCTLRPDIAKILDGTAVAVDKHDAQVVKKYWHIGQTMAECGCDTPILCGDEGCCVAAR